MKTAYIIPTCLPDSAALLMQWLKAYGFVPQLEPGAKADKIKIPEGQVNALQVLAKSDPARFGGRYFKLGAP